MNYETMLHIEYGNVVELIDLVKTSDEDLEYWVEYFRKVRIQLERPDSPRNISLEMKKAEISALKSIEIDLQGRIRFIEVAPELPF